MARIDRRWQALVGCRRGVVGAFLASSPRSKGHVHVFGPARLIEDRPLSEYRHKYVTGAYANTVFEKVELPELEQNPSVTGITYNGRPFG